MRRAAALLALCAGAPVSAGSLHVKVVDERGEPVERVAAYAIPANAAHSPASAPAVPHDSTSHDSTAHDSTMAQAHNAFVPHVLIVQSGTSVLFPNNDVVSHHVYSFSEPKQFELPLYKGNAHPPLLFEKPGVVVLGCNIHDGMLGYILVVDTPYFALTDRNGMSTLDSLPAGDYTLRIWTPRQKPSALPAEQTVTIAATGDETRVYKLTGKLLPDHEQASSSLTWERY
jgi:plastocyanin